MFFFFLFSFLNRVSRAVPYILIRKVHDCRTSTRCNVHWLLLIANRNKELFTMENLISFVLLYCDHTNNPVHCIALVTKL